METMRKLAFIALLGLPVMLFANESVNINTADKEMLMSINGIGEKRAEAIINYREENGKFKSLQELTEIKGIGPSLIDKNKGVLTVGKSNERP